MKKVFLTAAFIAVTSIASAQQDGQQQPNDDQLQQQAPRETQARTERAAKVEAVKQQSNSEIEAEKASKDKGQSQKQTKVQPVGINPDNPEEKPKDLSKQDLSKPKKILSEDSKRRN
ncbi:MAG TPA: hypothetical protein VK528_13980 [Flavobacterium sp.]|nr:hypothetical protein [Flavobacterium sp.]